MSLIEKLEQKAPKRNWVYTAVETLEEPRDIKQFYQEYICYLKHNGTSSEIKENAIDIANRNIGYILGYYGGEIVGRWMAVLPKVYHPIFGRSFSGISEEDVFKAGIIAGKEGIDNARRFIEKNRKRN